MKISKSGNKDPNIEKLSTESKLKAMESERNYWKTKYYLLLKYGK